MPGCFIPLIKVVVLGGRFRVPNRDQREITVSLQQLPHGTVRTEFIGGNPAGNAVTALRTAGFINDRALSAAAMESKMVIEL
jgi:hypothetical protein